MRNRLAVVPTQPAFEDSRQRQGRIRRRTYAENTVEASTLRDPGTSADVSGSLGGALGRHPHSRHNQATSHRYVRRREAGAATSASGAIPVLPLWRAHRARPSCSASDGFAIWPRKAWSPKNRRWICLMLTGGGEGQPNSCGPPGCAINEHEGHAALGFGQRNSSR
jgi:hypothetical protein